MKLSHAEFTFDDGTVVTFSEERGNDAACCMVSLPVNQRLEYYESVRQEPKE